MVGVQRLRQTFGVPQPQLPAECLQHRLKLFAPVRSRHRRRAGEGPGQRRRIQAIDALVLLDQQLRLERRQVDMSLGICCDRQGGQLAARDGFGFVMAALLAEWRTALSKVRVVPVQLALDPHRQRVGLGVGQVLDHGPGAVDKQVVGLEGR